MEETKHLYYVSENLEPKFKEIFLISKAIVEPPALQICIYSNMIKFQSRTQSIRVTNSER